MKKKVFLITIIVLAFASAIIAKIKPSGPSSPAQRLSYTSALSLSGVFAVAAHMSMSLGMMVDISTTEEIQTTEPAAVGIQL